jgi:hypothetical protein
MIGIKKARARGVKWGTNGSKLAQHNCSAADQFAESLHPLIFELMLTPRRGPVRLARELNRQGVPARYGGKWHPATVDRLLKRLPGLKEELAKAKKVQQQEFLATPLYTLAKKQAGDTGPI